MINTRVCQNFDDSIILQTSVEDLVKTSLSRVVSFFEIVEASKRQIIPDLVSKFIFSLEKMNAVDMTNIHNLEDVDYTSNALIMENRQIISAVGQATLHYAGIPPRRYEWKEKFDILFKDQIKGLFFPQYFLAYVLMDICSREFSLGCAREFTEIHYYNHKDAFTQKETIEEYAEIFTDNDCLKTHNFAAQVQKGQFVLKVTRCLWAEVYAELPDLELASLLECYGDFVKMPYINENFALSRYKTMVEGHSCCDFVFYDKRIIPQLNHPDNDFWDSLK